MPDTSALIDYAHPALDHGVVVLQESSTTYVIVPRLKGWRMLCRWEMFILLVLTVRTSAILSEGGIPHVSGPGAIAMLGWLSFIAWRKRVFAITPTHVRMGYVLSGRHIYVDEWPRHAIGEIRVNQYSGKLLIRVTGHDMKEHFVSKNRQITEYVAAALQTALLTAEQTRLNHSS